MAKLTALEAARAGYRANLARQKDATEDRRFARKVATARQAAAQRVFLLAVGKATASKKTPDERGERLFRFFGLDK